MTFTQKVYAVVSKIPPGKVMTYKGVAHALGYRSYRCVGQALAANSSAPRIPCHRVVCSDGRLGGYNGGVHLKRHLLESEGVHIVDDRIDLRRFGYLID